MKSEFERMSNSEKPRQLTGEETVKKIAEMTAEEWEPARKLLIAQEEARAEKMRARMGLDPLPETKPE